MKDIHRHTSGVKKRRWLNRALTLWLLVGFFGCGKQAEPSRAEITSEYFLHQGVQALQRHDFLIALAMADSAEHRFPEGASVHFFRGRVFSELGRFERAMEEYLKTLEIEPAYPGVWNNIGNNAFRQQNYQEAIGLYQKEFELKPAPIPLRGQGRAYIELGEIDSALQAFEKAIEIDSTYAQAYFSFALFYEDEGQYEDALEKALKALSLEPDNLDYRYLAGQYMVQTGRSEEALLYLQEVEKERPWHHGTKFNLGQALLRLGRAEEAKTYLDVAEKLRAGQARIGQLENTIRAMPDDPYAHAGLGFELRLAGQYNDAMHAYKVALYLDPANIEIRNNTASLYLIRGDTTEAIHQYEIILDLDPGQVDIWINLGIVYTLAEDFSQARRVWNNALVLDPANERVKAYLAKIANEP